MSWVVPITAAAMPAWTRLQEALQDTSVPCSGRDEWISPAAHERDLAARLCRGCPVLNACATYADTAPERNGVWGGRDRTRGKNLIDTIALFDTGTDTEETA